MAPTPHRQAAGPTPNRRAGGADAAARAAVAPPAGADGVGRTGCGVAAGASGTRTVLARTGRAGAAPRAGRPAAWPPRCARSRRPSPAAGSRRPPGSGPARRRPAPGTPAAPGGGSQRLALQPVGAPALRAGPLQPDLRVDVEQHGQVRPQPAGGPAGQPADVVHGQRPARALVGQRGVDVPVGEHHRRRGRAPAGSPCPRDAPGRPRTAAPRRAASATRPPSRAGCSAPRAEVGRSRLVRAGDRHTPLGQPLGEHARPASTCPTPRRLRRRSACRPSTAAAGWWCPPAAR